MGGGFGYLSHVSWFSEYFFPSFKMSGTSPKPNEVWSSTLFQPFGGLTLVGDNFFKYCAVASPTPPSPPRPMPPSPPSPAPPAPPAPPSPPGASCSAATAAQCKTSPCPASAPYLCAAGAPLGGCSDQSSFWPTHQCATCIDVSKC